MKVVCLILKIYQAALFSLLLKLYSREGRKILEPFFCSHFCHCLVFNAKPEEFDMCMKRQNVMQQDTFIKLRGLPFSCKLDDIEQFFSGKISSLYLSWCFNWKKNCMTAVWDDSKLSCIFSGWISLIVYEYSFKGGLRNDFLEWAGYGHVWSHSFGLKIAILLPLIAFNNNLYHDEFMLSIK